MTSYALGTTGTYRVPFLPVGEAEDALGLFLVEVENVCPEAPRRLRDEVLPVYASLPELKVPDNTKEFEKFEAAFLKWQQAFHLDRWTNDEADWRFKSLMELVLESWRWEPDDDLPLVPGFPDSYQEVVTRSREAARWGELLSATVLSKDLWTRTAIWSSPEFQRVFRALSRPHLPVYNPIVENREVYLARVSSLLRDYCSKVESRLEEAGAIKAKRKENLEHFTWLARYQILGERPRQIANKLTEDKDDPDGVAEDTVHKGIRDVAMRIGLKPWRRPGRPRKVEE